MKSLCLQFALGLLVLPLLASAANEKLVADGQTVVFLGDSITCYGAVKPDGYVKLVVSGLAANGINVKWFGAGVAGQKAWHMKERFERDVLARKPDLVTISAGVNDVWFPGADCTPEKFRADMQDMITRAKAAGIRVVLLTPSSAYANEGDDLRIQNYAKCVCELASANGVVLADTRKAFRALVDDPASPKIDAQGRKATVDGVHLAPTGNRAFAREVLRAFGLSDAERAKAEEEWNTKPFCPVSAHVAVPYPAYCALESATDARKHRFEDCCNELCHKGVAAMIADQKFDPPVAAEPVRPDEPHVAIREAAADEGRENRVEKAEPALKRRRLTLRRGIPSAVDPNCLALYRRHGRIPEVALGENAERDLRLQRPAVIANRGLRLPVAVPRRVTHTVDVIRPSALQVRLGAGRNDAQMEEAVFRPRR